MRRLSLTWVGAVTAAVVISGGFAQGAEPRPLGAAAKTLRFTALFLPGGRVVAHPPAGEAGNETYVNLKLVGTPGRPGSGTVYTIASTDGRSTRYRFRFTLRNGTLGLVGQLTATPSGGISQQFAVTTGTGAYKGARGSGTITKRPGGQPGIVVTIQLR